MKIISPLSVILPRKKKKDKVCYLNLNQYRNWHYRTSNEIKKKYCEEMREQLDGLNFKKVNISYQVFYSDKRKRDKGNIYSIIQKFFLDALVNRKCIEDDNDLYILRETFEIPIYDKGKGRVEITIEEVNE